MSTHPFRTSDESNRGHSAPPATPHDSPLDPPLDHQAVRWARAPWPGRLGRYVALRVVAGDLEVAIADAPRVRWIRAERALTHSELERWLTTGF